MMESGKGDHEIDRQVCLEQIQKAAHPFRFTRVFAPREQSEQWLALYAMTSAWERLVKESSEPEIALRKLEWWRYQCLQQELETSKHPVIRLLVHSGAVSHIDRDALARCLDHVAMRIASDPIDDMEALRTLCLENSRAQARLEIGWFDHPAAPGSAEFGLAQLIRESFGPACGNRFWWVPMNTLARYRLSRTALSEKAESEAVQSLFGVLAESIAAGTDEESATQSPGLHFHLLAHWSGRQVARLGGQRPQSLEKAMMAVKTSDYLSCWARARTLRRAALKRRPY